jgi:hypothetical protein
MSFKMSGKFFTYFLRLRRGEGKTDSEGNTRQFNGREHESVLFSLTPRGDDDGICWEIMGVFE